jgi:hypothetical protein
MEKFLKEPRLLRFLRYLTERIADLDEGLDGFLGIFNKVRIESTKRKKNKVYEYLHHEKKALGTGTHSIVPFGHNAITVLPP